MMEKYSDIRAQYIEIVDEHYYNLMLDVMKSKTAEGVCPKTQAKFEAFCGRVQCTLDVGHLLDIAKKQLGHVDEHDDLSFGRVRR